MLNARANLRGIKGVSKSQLIKSLTMLLKDDEILEVYGNFDCIKCVAFDGIGVGTYTIFEVQKFIDATTWEERFSLAEYDCGCDL